MEQPSSSFTRPRDIKRVSLSLLIPARPSEPVDPPEAPADRTVPAPLRKTFSHVPVIDPLESLACQWERQAHGLEDMSAAVGGVPSALQSAALLRENARELRETIQRKGGR